MQNLPFLKISRIHACKMTPFLGFANSRLPLKKYPLFRENGYERGMRFGREQGAGALAKYGVSLWGLISILPLLLSKYIDSLAQYCNNYSALAMELLQSCTKRSIYIVVLRLESLRYCWADVILPSRMGEFASAQINQSTSGTVCVLTILSKWSSPTRSIILQHYFFITSVHCHVFTISS